MIHKMDHLFDHVNYKPTSQSCKVYLARINV